MFKSNLQPEWGLGLVVESGPDHVVLMFEHGGRRKFIKSKARGLVAVQLEADALSALTARAHGRRAKASATPKVKAARLAADRRSTARFTTFQEQVAFFEKHFVGGFAGERFIQEERGGPGAQGKKGSKEAGIALAQAELSRERFAQGTPEALFESARRVLQATNLVFPLEGALPFARLEPARRGEVLAALEQLLHGEDAYGARLERFARAVNLKDKAGQAKAVTWPFATVFAALLRPEAHVCVKPAAFASQAITLGLSVEKVQPVTAHGAEQFHEVATRTQARLREVGHAPRDLMDVCSFISRTHAEKSAS